MRALPIAILAVALSGCYGYAEPEVGAPAPGQQMRAHLTLTGGDSLARFLGPNIASVDGRLVLSTESAYELGVTMVLSHSGMEQYWKGETVTLPKTLIASVQVRKFSWGRTGLLAGVVLATFYALGKTGVINGTLFNGGGSGNQQ